MNIPFIQAAHFTPASRSAVDLLVLHTMEHPEKPGTAQAVAEWFADPLRAPQASAHYTVDNLQIFGCVFEKDIAWAAPGANRNGIHIEHAGYAAFSSADWASPYSAAMLELSAMLAAEICKHWSIPARLVIADELQEGGARGITTHAQVSLAFRLSDHSDPGPSFPIGSYVSRVASLLQSIGGTP